MGKIVYVKIAGKQYPMRFGIRAMKALNERFGSMESMTKRLTNAESDIGEAVDAMSFILATLISQGCEYKNLFEKGVPVPEDAAVKDGEFVPISKTAIEIALDISDISQMQKSILECFNMGQKQEIEVEEKKDEKSKNEKAM